MIATVTLNPSLDEWVSLPSLRLGQLNRAGGFARYPGGKGINVSRVLHELGGRTVAFALAGGEDGHILRTLMDRLAIPHEFVAVAGSTRNNYKIQTERPKALTELNTPGQAVSSTALHRLARRLLARIASLDAIVFSGSLPPGVPVSTYATWIRRFRQQGVLTVLDASGPAFRQGLRARPWLVKPNRQEAEEALGRRIRSESSAAQAVRALLRLGPARVILSLGADGAVMGAADPPGLWVARPPAVRVVSGVGAGDSLVGGFLWSWMRRRSLIEALRWGIASGAATAMTPGTELCHRAEVRRLAPRVIIRRLAD